MTPQRGAGGFTGQTAPCSSSWPFRGAEEVHSQTRATFQGREQCLGAVGRETGAGKEGECPAGLGVRELQHNVTC